MRFPDYLAAKGAIKTLTKKEAEIFGIPYPLINGWPSRYCNVTVTTDMIDRLRAAFGSNSTAAGLRVRRGIAAASGEALPVSAPVGKTTHRHDDSDVEMLRQVYEAARSLLRDAAQTLSAVNALSAAVDRLSGANKSPDLSGDGPPWEV